MKRKLLIFGGGQNQMSLIEAAKELELISIVIDPSQNPPGKSVADYFYQVAPNDYQQTMQIAIDHNVSAIVTGQMEKPLKLMARLAVELGFIFHTPEIIERSTNKYLMKQAFIKAGIPCAKGALITDAKVLSSQEFLSLKLPVIIKPTSSFSSRGVYRIDCYDSYLKYIDDTLSFCPTGDYLIEDFIEGPEFSVETISFNGDTTIVQVTEKLITPYPRTVELGHLQPANISSELFTSLSVIVTRAIKALGIDNSAAHTEVKLTATGFVIIEIGPRLGGDFISSHLTYASTGISMDKAAIQVALGEEPLLKRLQNRGSTILYLMLTENKVIKEISLDYDKLNLLEGLEYWQLNCKCGDAVPCISDSSKRMGWVLTSGKDKTSAYNLALLAKKFIEQSIQYYA
ncbi:MAG: ATP-grasp domain-containing protein [Candidatus Cloacimonetes bacterium]|nr:ATP-grasp domain-containing protein [Candidatus Cloacimonadota bacterium]